MSHTMVCQRCSCVTSESPVLCIRCFEHYLTEEGENQTHYTNELLDRIVDLEAEVCDLEDEVHYTNQELEYYKGLATNADDYAIELEGRIAALEGELSDYRQ